MIRFTDASEMEVAICAAPSPTPKDATGGGGAGAGGSDDADVTNPNSPLSSTPASFTDKVSNTLDKTL